MSSKNKVILSVFMLAMLAIGSIVAVVTIFALSHQAFNASVKVSYEANDIVGKVEMYTQLGNGEEVFAGEFVFDVDTEGGEINVVDDVELTGENNKITLHYIFTNAGDCEYTAILNYNKTDLILSNMNVMYSQTGEEDSYTEYGYGLVVDKTSQKHYYTEISVTDLAFDASADGFLTWKLERYEPTLNEQSININAVDYVDNKDGTYSAKYNGGDISVVNSASGLSAQEVQNLWYVPSRIGSAPVVSVVAGQTLPANTKVVITDGIESIGSTFASSRIVEISLPKSVTIIPSRAFNNCSYLTSVTLSNGLTSIGDSAFYNCSRLTSVDIPNSVTSIGSSAFYYCSGLTQVSLSNGLKTIGNSAFTSCYTLTRIEIPGSVTNFGESVFTYCSQLSDVVIKNGVTTIPNNSFSNCTNLTNVSLPESVSSIGNSAFSNCTYLESIDIPDNVVSLGNNVFDSCSTLSSISIGAGLESIGTNAFVNCGNLTNLTINNENSTFQSAGNCLIDDATDTLILGFYNTVIPNDGSVVTIGTSAFSECTGLTSIIIPDSVKTISNNAFYKCSDLTTIVLGNNVETIGDSAFYCCDSLENITIPNTTKTIGAYAFYECESLTSVVIPDSVTSMGDYAFNSCSSLTSAVVGNGVTVIGEYAFYYCSKLSSVTIGTSVTSLGTSSFYCTALTEIYIPQSVKTIYKYAFSGCSKLTSVVFEVTSGWKYNTSNSTSSGAKTFSATSLADPATAATYLRSSYIKYYWKRT